MDVNATEWAGKRYAAPRLVVHGKMVQLTAGGISGCEEGTECGGPNTPRKPR